MELIQNSLYNREGKKWKRRWACLKRVSPNSAEASNEDTYLIVFLYKSQDHAIEGKEKHVIPLMDFCGLECRKQYDRSNDVLIIITASQTSFFSFGERSFRDQWVRILEDQFGKALTYSINIPDKQKKKNAESTIRIHRNFFSIVNSNYKCLNRWFTNDIKSFSADGDSQFMFEIGPQNKSKGLLVNIVTSDVEELLKAFETVTAEQDDSGLTRREFTGSSILIDIEQSKRNAGDSNFIRRAILRASDRLRKKHRNRTQSTPTTRKYLRPSKSMNDSMSDEKRFRSLDRKKSPDIGVHLNNVSKEKTIILLRSVSPPISPVKNFGKQISIDDAPPVPKKKSPTASSSSQPVTLERKSEPSHSIERTLLKPRSMTISGIPIPKDLGSISKEQTTKSEEKLASGGSAVMMKENSGTQTPDEITKKLKLTMSPTDKSEIIKLHPRRSTDSVTNNNHKQPANPAHYALAKTKRKIDKKTPTPPPRSPVSLGLAPQSTVFDFPPTDQVEDTMDGKEQESQKLNQPFKNDINIKRRTFHSSGSDDAFASFDASPSVFDYSNVDSPGEPAYGNISLHMRKDSSDDNSSQIVAAHNARRLGNSSKQQSDPLSVEQWSLATGEGQQITSLNNFRDQDQDRLDYINVKTNVLKNEDSPHGSYVNVSTSESGKPEIGGSLRKGRKNIPAPLILKTPTKSYKNDFEIYDDDDSSIYHAVGPLDSDAGSRGSASSIIGRRAGGSYENISIKIGRGSSNVNHKSDYLNLMSPLTTKSKNMITSKSMNYAVLPDHHLFSKSVSTSPVRGSARSPIEKPNKSDYTLIDEIGTDALNRTKNSREKQLFSTGNKTPTKTLK